MDREILFQGQSLNEEGRVLGSLLTWGDGNTSIVVPEGEKRGTLIRVYPETVGQYTGLTDAKGEKIFEGDVIRNKNNKGNTDFVVEWYDGGFVCRDIKVRAFGNDLTQSDANTMEIVGNIHDDEEYWRLNHEYQMQQD